MDGGKKSFEVKWRKETRTAKYATASGCAIVGDRVYFFSGRESGWCYYRTRKKWAKIEGSPWILFFLPCATLVDDRIIILGGMKSGFRQQTETEALEFDVATGNFEVVQTKASPPRPQKHTAVFAEWRREIVVFGGYVGSYYLKTNKSYSFNVDKKVWTECFQKGQVPEARSNHTATIVRRCMYVHGGSTSAGYRETFESVLSLYIADLSLSYCLTWSTPRCGAESPAIGGYRYPSINAVNGQLLIIGGNSEGSERAVFTFHPDHLEWNRARVVKVAKKHIPPVELELCFAVPVHNGILCFAEEGVFEAEISEDVHE